MSAPDWELTERWPDRERITRGSGPLPLDPTTGFAMNAPHITLRWLRALTRAEIQAQLREPD